MAGKTGYDPIANTDEFDPPADITAVAKHFDDLIDFMVDDATKLPQSGNWEGRQVRTKDTRKVYVCTALPSTWVGEEAYATFTTLIGGLPDGAYQSAGTVTPVPTATKNASWVTLGANNVLTVAVGVYIVSWDVSTRVAATANPRSGFVDVIGPSGIRVGRANFGIGEDTATASGVMIVTAAGAIRFSLYKSGGGTPNVSGTITITKVA